jgi:ABC-type Fe3+/spermidine/putrescine transport system ATPase subunit
MERESVCLELKRLQRETGTTAIHVCHDFEEARLVADRIGVMRSGELVQAGEPEELFTRPRDTELARFLRVGSILPGVGEGGRIRIEGGELLAEASVEGPVELLIRADDVLVGGDVSGDNVLEGTAVFVSPRGPYTRVEVQIAPGTRLQANLPRTVPAPAEGARVRAAFPASAVHVFGA